MTTGVVQLRPTDWLTHISPAVEPRSASAALIFAPPSAPLNSSAIRILFNVLALSAVIRAELMLIKAEPELPLCDTVSVLVGFVPVPITSRICHWSIAEADPFQ